MSKPSPSNKQPNKRKLSAVSVEEGEVSEPAPVRTAESRVLMEILRGHTVNQDLDFLGPSPNLNQLQCCFTLGTGSAVHSTWLDCTRSQQSGVVNSLSVSSDPVKNARYLDIMRITHRLLDSQTQIFYPRESKIAVVFPRTTTSEHFCHSVTQSWLKAEDKPELPFAPTALALLRRFLSNKTEGVLAFIQAVLGLVRKGTLTAEILSDIRSLTEEVGAEKRIEAAMRLTAIFGGATVRTFLSSFGVEDLALTELAAYLQGKTFRVGITCILACHATAYLPLPADSADLTTPDGTACTSKPLKEVADTDFVLLSMIRVDDGRATYFGRNDVARVYVMESVGPHSLLQKTGSQKRGTKRVQMEATPAGPIRDVLLALYRLGIAPTRESKKEEATAAPAAAKESGTASLELDL